jgi:DNA-binding MarR family transcriptional regulator
VPGMKLAQELKQFAEEILDISKDFWTIQSQSKSKNEPEVTETEFLALDLLTRSQPMSVGEIQKHIGVLPAQMSRIVRSLEHKGEKPLIKCTINPSDKRKIDVELTGEGRKAHEVYRQVKLGSIEKMLQGLREQDRWELLRILREIGQQMRKGLKKQ